MIQKIKEEVKKRFGVKTECFYDKNEKQYVLRLFNVVGNKFLFKNKIYDLEEELFPNGEHSICSLAYDIEETKEYFPDKYNCNLFWKALSNFNLKKTVQAINFFLQNHRPKQLNELSLLKMIFFADRYCLLKTGCTITGDTYYAMRKGPVASGAKSILNRDSQRISSEELKYIETYFVTTGAKTKSIAKYDRTMFSENELDALKESNKLFGYLEQEKIDVPEYTHQFFNWVKDYEPYLPKNGNKRRSISPLEFFNIIPEDYCSIIPDNLREESLNKIKRIAEQ